MKARMAVYAGVFDPLTLGHWDVIEQGVALFDHLTIGIGRNPGKNPMLSVQERVEDIAECIRIKMRQVALVLDDLDKWGKVDVIPFEDEFLVKFAERRGCNYILRGLRDSEDFRQEQAYNFFNQSFNPEIKTVYVMPDTRFSAVSSSAIKGMIGPEGWEEFIKPYLPEPTYRRILSTFWKQQ